MQADELHKIRERQERKEGLRIARSGRDTGVIHDVRAAPSAAAAAAASQVELRRDIQKLSEALHCLCPVDNDVRLHLISLMQAQMALARMEKTISPPHSSERVPDIAAKVPVGEVERERESKWQGEGGRQGPNCFQDNETVPSGKGSFPINVPVSLPGVETGAGSPMATPSRGSGGVREGEGVVARMIREREQAAAAAAGAASTSAVAASPVITKVPVAAALTRGAALPPPPGGIRGQGIMGPPTSPGAAKLSSWNSRTPGGGNMAVMGAQNICASGEVAGKVGRGREESVFDGQREGGSEWSGVASPGGVSVQNHMTSSCLAAASMQGRQEGERRRGTEGRDTDAIERVAALALQVLICVGEKLVICVKVV